MLRSSRPTRLRTRELTEDFAEKTVPLAFESGPHLAVDRAVDRSLTSYLEISPNSPSRFVSGPGLCTSKRRHYCARRAYVRTCLTLAEAAWPRFFSLFCRRPTRVRPIHCNYHRRAFSLSRIRRF